MITKRTQMQFPNTQKKRSLCETSIPFYSVEIGTLLLNSEFRALLLYSVLKCFKILPLEFASKFRFQTMLLNSVLQNSAKKLDEFYRTRISRTLLIDLMMNQNKKHWIMILKM